MTIWESTRLIIKYQQSTVLKRREGVRVRDIVRQTTPRAFAAHCHSEAYMSNNKNNLQLVQRLQEFSIPLIAGVIVALVCANLNFSLYEGLVHKPFYELGSLFSEHAPLTDATDTAHSATVTHQTALVAHDQSEPATGSHGGGHESPWAHFLTMHFLVNDIFMVFFFGIAAKEITEACLPGGSLNPIRKAINPLFGTLGGVLGPAGVYLLLNAVMGRPEWSKGWGIPTATDIALAWLVARFLFGKGHAAVSFLLLLAVADDGIGLGIIAVAYPDPAHPTVGTFELHELTEDVDVH